MRKKQMIQKMFNKLFQIALLAICISAIAVGIYAAKSASITASGTVGFTVHNCKMKINSTVVCASNSTPTATANYSRNNTETIVESTGATATNGTHTKYYFYDISLKVLTLLKRLYIIAKLNVTNRIVCNANISCS